MVQTCRSINVHEVNTDSCMLRPNSMFMDCRRKQTHQCALYKVKIIYYQTRQQKHSGKNFLKKINLFWFPWCSTRENLSIHVPITPVRLILTKLRWFQHFGISQNTCKKFNFDLFWKENQILGFPCCSTCKTFLLMYHWLFYWCIRFWYWRSYGDFFSRGTDRQTGFWNPHMETCRHTKNFNPMLKIRS